MLFAVAMLGCATPHTGRPQPAGPPDVPPIEVDSALLEDDAVARAREQLPDALTTGVLYPPTDAHPDGAYGILRSEPSVVRWDGDTWLVAFAFRCPDDPTRGRVVRVYDDGSTRLVYPPVLLPSLEPAGPDDSALAERDVRAVENPEHPDAVGAWFAARPASEPVDGVEQVGPAPFVYDGRTVILSLWALRSFEWRPEDTIYRVEASWSGDVLRIRYPAGGVEDFARFRDGRFEFRAHDERPAAAMERATPRSWAGGWHAELLRPRPVHDYALPINSGPIVVRCSGGDCDSSVRSPVSRICNP